LIGAAKKEKREQCPAVCLQFSTGLMQQKVGKSQGKLGLGIDAQLPDYKSKLWDSQFSLSDLSRKIIEVW
jgi:hypothetical protein